MKPSDDPRNPFNPNYKAKINWAPQQRAAQNQNSVTLKLEQKRLADANYDKKVGMIFNDTRGTITTLPKDFNVYAKARPKQL